MNLPSRSRTALAFGALLALAWAGQVQAAVTGTFEHSIALDGPVIVDVTTGSGSITIRTGPSGRAEVKGNIRVGDRGFFGVFRRSDENMQEIVDRLKSEPPVELSGGRLLIGHMSDRALLNNVSIDYEIVVPVGVEVQSRTGSGAQTITGVAGPVEVESGSGSLTLTDIGGAVTAHAGSGAIRGDNIAGPFEAHAGSGSVRLTQTAPGDVEVSTGSGGIELRGVVGALHVHAGSGRIVVDGRQRGPWDLDTSSGAVQIDLPDDAAFELDAESSSGSITVDHPVTVTGTTSKRHLRGAVRGGGDLLHVETASGSIRIE